MGVPYNLPPPKAGDRCWVHQPPPHPPPSLGSLGRNPLPPSIELPLSPGNYHLGLTSVKTSFWPLNLGQKSWFGHKMTEWSISGQTASLYEVGQLS